MVKVLVKLVREFNLRESSRKENDSVCNADFVKIEMMQMIYFQILEC